MSAVITIAIAAVLEIFALGLVKAGKENEGGR